MDFRGARLAQKLYDSGACRAAHNRIVDHDDALAAHGIRNRIELDAHLILTALLTGRDKGAADIFVLDKADSIRNAGRSRIAERRVQAGIGHADDDIRIHRMLCRQKLAGAHARRMDRVAVDHGIGTGKIDVFKNAK